MDIADYDKSGYDYKRFWESRQYEDRSERLALSELLPKNGQALIDLGGGYGRLIDIYTPYFPRCVLLDYSERNLDLARVLAQTANIGNLEIKRGDIYNLPFGNAEFDTVLMVRVIHHLIKPQKALQEISRVIRQNGVLILEFSNKIHLKARIRAWLRREWGFVKDTKPIELPCSKDDPEQKGIVFNFHPTHIIQLLEDTGFSVERKISVSNLRNPLLKKLLPLRILLLFEFILQRLSSLSIHHFNFGPSIVLRCRKRNKESNGKFAPIF